MKKIYFVLAIIFIFTAASFATNARMTGMGLGGVPWMVPLDDELITPFPGLLGNFRNNFVANKDNNSGYINIGVSNFTIGAFDNPYVGTILSAEPLLPSGNIVSYDTKADVETVRVPSNFCGIMASMAPSDSLGLGLLLGIASNASSDNSTPSNYDIWTNFNRTDLFDDSSLAVKLNLGASFKDTADFGIALELPFIDNTGTVSNYNFTNNGLVTAKIADGSLKTTGGIGVTVNARAMMFMPFIIGANVGINNIQTTDIYNTYNVSSGILTSSNKGTRSFSAFNLNLGACYNININNNVTLIPGIVGSYSSNTLKSVIANETASPIINTTNNEVDSSSFNLPLYIAAESKINEILTVRFGVSQMLFSSMGSTNTNNIFSPATQDVMNQTLPATTVFSGGFSININNISIDAVISNIATTLSLKYSWYTVKQVE